MVTPAMKSSRARHNPAASGDPTATATVDSLSYDGRGVARLEGKTVFIEGALPGERVRFRYLNRRRNYDDGALVEILEASPDRVTPPCPHFGSCGGCGLQHLRSEVQIQSKQQILAEQLTHIGRVQPLTWLDPVTGPALGYRRRARLGVWQVPERPPDTGRSLPSSGPAGHLLPPSPSFPLPEREREASRGALRAHSFTLGEGEFVRPSAAGSWVGDSLRVP